MGGNDVLNPELFDLISDKVGAVQVANRGSSFIGETYVGGDGGLKWDIRQSGEYYAINCPFCNDTRKRLWINHRYGEWDEAKQCHKTWLCICFNEHCVDSADDESIENRRRLEDLVFGHFNRRERSISHVILEGRAEADSLEPVRSPGTLVRVDALDGHHPAVRYLVDRGFDVSQLGRLWAVSYCTQADRDWPEASGRVIIPIYMGRVLVGWQGRYVGDVDWRASRRRKYYNLPGMPRRLMLYNIDQASRRRVVVIVEGVTSVWSIGQAGVATLGKTISEPQLDLLTGRWGRRRGLAVLMFDPDADREARAGFHKLRARFLGQGGAAVMVTLPAGRDPGMYSHEAIWDIIRGAAAEQGVDVDNYL